MSATIEGRAVATMVASIADSSVITTSDTNSRRRETARGGAVESEVISGEVAFSILGRDHRRGLVRGTRRLAGPTGGPLEEAPLRRLESNGTAVRDRSTSGADAHFPGREVRIRAHSRRSGEGVLEPV